MKLTIYFLTVFVLFSTISSYAQESETIATKTGWSIGGMPIIAYDSDLGFKYGILGNVYDYGNGSYYPTYKHSLYGEFSQSSKGTGTYFMKYDSKFVFDKVRLSATMGYFTDQFLDFYGFNGYEANYDADFTKKNSPYYISRAYYRQSRKMFRTTFDLTGDVEGCHFKWVAGISTFDMKMGSVDVEGYNRQSSKDDTLPSLQTTPGLYEKYVKCSLIKASEKNGGSLINLKTGLVYDSRDNEANPMKGVWTELLLVGSYVLSSTKPLYLQLVATHRHYFTLIKEKLGLATRIGYQQKIAGEMPYYMLPILFTSNRPPMNGLGGYMNLRGVLRNRLQGEGLCYANIEMRWKAIKGTINRKNNFYAALSTFSDLGMVTKRYLVDQDMLKKLGSSAEGSEERIHQSLGAGLHLAYNHNFIVSLYYGQPFNKQDGSSGIYTDIDFLF